MSFCSRIYDTQTPSLFQLRVIMAGMHASGINRDWIIVFIFTFFSKKKFLGWREETR